MWYKYALNKNSNYNPKTWQYYKHLKEGFKPEDWKHMLEYFFEEGMKGYPLEDIMDTDDLPPIYTPEGRKKWIQIIKSHPFLSELFQKYIERTRYMAMDEMQELDPPYAHMQDPEFHKPMWLVHFSNNAEAIMHDGFIYGSEDLKGTSLTRPPTIFFDDKSNAEKAGKSGYNFAFEALSEEAEQMAEDGLYGENAVIFKSTAVSATHVADRAREYIFWGPSVDPSNIYLVEQRKDFTTNGDVETKWVVENFVGRDVAIKDRYIDVAKWVIQNHGQLDNTREKVKRRWNLGKKEKQQQAEELRNLDFEDATAGSWSPKKVFDMQEAGVEVETLADIAQIENPDIRKARLRDILPGNSTLATSFNRPGWEFKFIDIYRACDVSDKILPGHYVTESLDYAKQHMESNLHGDGKIMKMSVLPQDLVTMGAPHEFIYYPTLGRAVIFSDEQQEV